MFSSIYIMGLVLDWVKEQGGIQAMEERANLKSQIIYDVFRECGIFYE